MSETSQNCYETKSRGKIPVSQIQGHPLNPRCDFSNISELAESIREHGGHPFNPILARPLSDGYYQVITGHSRLKAMKDALHYRELEVGKDIIVREMDDATAVRVMADDNIKRQQYKPAEFAEALKLLTNACGVSLREVARQYNVSASWLDDMLSISKLPDRVKAKVEWGKGRVAEAFAPSRKGTTKRGGVITVTHAKQLAKLDSHDDQTKAALAIEKFRLDADETKEIVSSLKRDPWASVDDLVHNIRNNLSSASVVVSRLTLEITDSRVAEALSRAAKTTSRTPEEYVSAKLVEGLTNDGFLSERVLRQDEYRRWMEDEVLASQARRPVKCGLCVSP